VVDGEHESVWDHLNIYQSEAGLQPLLKVMVLLGEAPADFMAKLPPQNADIAIWGRQIRVLRPANL
jgi:hypothetical protein